jgi:hypothetical protein
MAPHWWSPHRNMSGFFKLLSFCEVFFLVRPALPKMLNIHTRTPLLNIIEKNIPPALCAEFTMGYRVPGAVRKKKERQRPKM